MSNEEYKADNIKVLKGLEAVRKRPGMYIGGTGIEGLHHLVKELVDNAIDEALAGHCDKVNITIHADNSVTVQDNGRGIPVDKHSEGKSAAEVIFTVLHAGGKFDKSSYKVSGGLHGVGSSVVNALSKKMHIEIFKNGKEYHLDFENQKEVNGGLREIGPTKQTGTKVKFWPDTQIFQSIEFDYKIMKKRYREFAFLNPNVTIVFTDERNNIEEVFHYEGGLSEFIKYMIKGDKQLIKDIISVSGERDDVTVDIALTYTDSYNEKLEGFVNNIATPGAGTHVSGFKLGITKAMKDYIAKNGKPAEQKLNLNGDDIREGITAIVSVKVPEPQFEGQTKDKLGNPEVQAIVSNVFYDEFYTYLDENPKGAQSIIDKAAQAKKAREAAKKARDLVRRKNVLEFSSLPGKLADCSSKVPEDCELFIVEGDSAGGCFDGDTKISLLDGRELSFKELIEEDKKGIQNYCYTIKNDGNIGVEKILNPRLTKKNAELIEIELDNGEKIKCTPCHRFMIRTGKYVRAKNLKIGESLMPLYKKLSKKEGKITIEGYEMVHLDETYYEKSMMLMKELFDKNQLEEYDKIRIKNKDKSILKYNSIIERYFDKNENSLINALKTLNHKIVGIKKLSNKKDVYDIEVPNTHNFALASGVFVHNSAKQARLRENQAILPLRGKPLNVEKARIVKILENEEIKTLITALGTGFGENFDPEKLRYHKIIIMADADVDGAHIATLVLTLFFRHFRELILRGHIFIAMPPLYKVKIGKSAKYLYNDLALEEYRKENQGQKIEIQRYKGLGEMNPEQLWETTLDPKYRYIKKVTIDDAIEADLAFSMLMGDKVEPRRNFIIENAQFVKDLDI